MLFLLVSIGFLAYCLSLAIYRLLISPIARFPGPKLAALTWWYEFYYDVIKHGQFYNEIERLHSIYGPIVRINPTELHVKDPDWFPELYTSAARPRDKSDWFTARSGGESVFGTVPHALHRKRRAALSPFFSKQAINNLEPTLRSIVEELTTRMYVCISTGEVIEMDNAYMALTLDVISGYAFGESLKLLEKDDFGAEWGRIMRSAIEANTVGRNLPWIPTLILMMPDQVAAAISEPVSFFLKLQKDVKLKVEATLARDKVESRGHRTIFEELRDSDLPAQEKSVTRLMDEGVILLGAGGETTAATLTTMTFHLLNTPSVLEKLRMELDGAIVDPKSHASLQELERLPYLRATILEAHRMASVITTRLIRIATGEALHYGDWNIPAGTPISMSTHFMHLDPTIFDSPLEFRPERFLSSSFELEKYVIPFSKGSRGCIGLNLASAELYLTVAHVFRRFELELYETTYEDVQITWDSFTGGRRPESKGVRVRVVKERS